MRHTHDLGFSTWKLIAVLTLGALCFVPATAEELMRQPDDSRDVVLNLVLVLEEAYGVEPYASRTILEHSEHELEMALELLEDREGFLEKARQTLAAVESLRVVGDDDRDLPPVSRVVAGDAYPPNYPPDSGWYHYNIIGPLRVMGAANFIEERCGDYDHIPWTEELAFDLQMASELGDTYCSAAGCDPFGVLFCVETCAPVAILKTLTWLAKLPMEMCKFHDDKIDAAELEAGYENSVTLLSNLERTENKVDALKSQLTGHETHVANELTRIENDLELIKGRLGQQGTMLETVLLHQEYIMELLNTPQGQRPNWNDKDR